jgi:predicted O-methyltransferase YrrM
MPSFDSIKIYEFIDSLNVQIPSKEKFLQLNRIFPISQKTGIKTFNYERGILLYSLIAKYKPKNVLEIGTAEGYSAIDIIIGHSPRHTQRRITFGSSNL